MTVREMYRVEEGLPKVSKALRVKLAYDAPDLKAKIASVSALAMKYPGELPVVFTLACKDGTEIDLSLKAAPKVALTLAFLSELAKIVPQNETDYSPSREMRLAPPEPRPWEQ